MGECNVQCTTLPFIPTSMPVFLEQLPTDAIFQILCMLIVSHRFATPCLSAPTSASKYLEAFNSGEEGKRKQLSRLSLAWSCFRDIVQAQRNVLSRVVFNNSSILPCPITLEELIEFFLRDQKCNSLFLLFKHLNGVKRNTDRVEANEHARPNVFDFWAQLKGIVTGLTITGVSFPGSETFKEIRGDMEDFPTALFVNKADKATVDTLLRKLTKLCLINVEFWVQRYLPILTDVLGPITTLPERVYRKRDTDTSDERPAKRQALQPSTPPGSPLPQHREREEEETPGAANDPPAPHAASA